jgi:hypothetical protein
MISKLITNCNKLSFIHLYFELINEYLFSFILKVNTEFGKLPSLHVD